MVDIDALRMIDAVVRQRSFTEAAQRLFVTQPALSRKIAEFERHVGFKIFDRTRRPVALTEEGEQVYDAIVDLLHCESFLEERLMLVKSGRGTRLHVAFGMGGHLRFLSNVLVHVHKRYPNASIDFENVFNPESLPALQAGDIDAVVCNAPEAEGYEGLVRHTVMPCGLVAVLPPDSPLALKSSLRVSDLQGQPLATFARFGSPQVYDRLVAYLGQGGIDPRFCHLANDAVSFSAFVPLYRDVAVMPATVLISDPSLVRVVPLEDAPCFDVEVVTRRGDARPVLGEFIDAFQTLYGA